MRRDKTTHDEMRLKTRERIIEAALRLIDRDGLAGLSMRKLGAEVGLEAMTIYYYIVNKEALFDSLIEKMVADTLADMVQLVGDPMEWASWLRAFATAFRRELMRHPNLVALVATRPVMEPRALRSVEKLGSALSEAGFGPQHAFHVLNTVSTFVTGHVLAEAGSPPGHEDSDSDTASLLNQLNPAEFPCFSAAVASGLGTANDHQARFEFGLNALLAGFALFLSQTGQEEN